MERFVSSTVLFLFYSLLVLGGIFYFYAIVIAIKNYEIEDFFQLIYWAILVLAGILYFIIVFGAIIALP